MSGGERGKVAGRLCLLLLLFAAPLSAQIGMGAIVSYAVDVYDISKDPNGVGPPLVSMTIPAAAALCNLAPLAAPKTLTAYNPQAVYWTDPINAGRICKLSAPLLGTLPTLGNGSSYVLTLTTVDDQGRVGPKSAVSLPFNNSAPTALSGVSVR